MQDEFARQMKEARSTLTDKHVEDLMKLEGKTDPTIKLEPATDARLLYAKVLYNHVHDFLERVILKPVMNPCAISREAMRQMKEKMAIGGDTLKTAMFSLAQSFDKVLSPLEDAKIARNDPSVLEELEKNGRNTMLSALKLKKKFSDVSNKPRIISTLWEWLKLLKEDTANFHLYNSMPSGIMKAMMQLATELQREFKDTGKIEGKKLRPLWMGQRVLELSGPKDKQKISEMLQTNQLDMSMVVQLVHNELKKMGITIDSIMRDGVQAVMARAKEKMKESSKAAEKVAGSAVAAEDDSDSDDDGDDLDLGKLA